MAMFTRWYVQLGLALVGVGSMVPTAVGAAGQLGTESQQQVANFLKLSGYASSGTPASPIVLIGAGINLFLSLFGLVFLVLTVYAGVKWMTAGGNTEQIDAAKSMLRNAAIGLAIVLLAFVLTYTVIRLLGRGGGFQTGLDQTTFP